MASLGPEIVRHAVPRQLRGHVARMTGYREPASAAMFEVEPASLMVPVILSFGAPFRISLGPGQDKGTQESSFVAGLIASAVGISSQGGAECIQIDLTPPGAHALLGGAMGDIAARLVPIYDILGPEGEALRQRLGNVESWPDRFRLTEAFLAGKFRHAASPVALAAWKHLGGDDQPGRIDALAADLGVSRRHLTRVFRQHFGLGPKSVMRIRRFEQACAMVRQQIRPGIADIAAACGYADQAHMTREFRDLGGAPPLAFIRRRDGRSGDP